MKLPQKTQQAVMNEVEALLSGDVSGHGMEHIHHVIRLALSFIDSEAIDESVVWLAAALHDVDDYKVFGEAHARGLVHARRILRNQQIDAQTADHVLEIIGTMGYTKYLDSIRPSTQEGKIVSDADMCEAIGAEGILRTYAFSSSRGSVFFDPLIPPRPQNESSTAYKDSKGEHTVQHFFDKLLTIHAILLTEPGRAEGAKRQQIMVDFLAELFREEEASGWMTALEPYKEGEKPRRDR